MGKKLNKKPNVKPEDKKTSYEYGKGSTGYGDPLYNIKVAQNEHFTDDGQHANKKKKSDVGAPSRQPKSNVQYTSRGYRHTGKSAFGEKISTSRGGTYEDENGGSASRGRSSSEE